MIQLRCCQPSIIKNTIGKQLAVFCQRNQFYFKQFCSEQNLRDWEWSEVTPDLIMKWHYFPNIFSNAVKAKQISNVTNSLIAYWLQLSINSDKPLAAIDGIIISLSQTRVSCVVNSDLQIIITSMSVQRGLLLGIPLGYSSDMTRVGFPNLSYKVSINLALCI